MASEAAFLRLLNTEIPDLFKNQVAFPAFLFVLLQFTAMLPRCSGLLATRPHTFGSIAMQFQPVRQTSAILLLALTLMAVSCGDPQGIEVGKDPNVPVSVKPKNPETNSPTNPQENRLAPSDGSGAGSNPNAGGNPSDTPNQPPVAGAPTAPKGATLTVSVNGIRTERGNVCLSLFNSPDGFPDSGDKAILAECFTVVGRSFDIKIEDVPPGTYAIALWHDENRDRKMNYNFLGIPKEGVAFSENGRPRISPPPGPPNFSAIAFEMKSEPRSTSSKMTYLLDFL